MPGNAREPVRSRRVHMVGGDADEVWRAAPELRANLAETQRECLQRTGMAKAKMPEYQTYSKSLGKQHAERIAQGRTRERLTSEQEKALLGKQYDTADGLGKVDQNEPFATRALGYTEEYETLEEADRTGGQVQEGGRVKRDGKVGERERGADTHYPSPSPHPPFPCTTGSQGRGLCRERWRGAIERVRVCAGHRKSARRRPLSCARVYWVRRRKPSRSQKSTFVLSLAARLRMNTARRGGATGSRGARQGAEE